MFFMLRWQANADESTQRNHDEWRDWLTEERNKYREERQKAREERDAWRQFMRHRDEEHVAAMTAVEKQMALQTNILMAIVATSGNDVEKTVETLEKLTGNQ